MTQESLMHLSVILKVPVCKPKGGPYQGLDYAGTNLRLVLASRSVRVSACYFLHSWWQPKLSQPQNKTCSLNIKYRTVCDWFAEELHNHYQIMLKFDSVTEPRTPNRSIWTELRNVRRKTDYISCGFCAGWRQSEGTFVLSKWRSFLSVYFRRVLWWLLLLKEMPLTVFYRESLYNI